MLRGVVSAPIKGIQISLLCVRIKAYFKDWIQGKDRSSLMLVPKTKLNVDAPKVSATNGFIECHILKVIVLAWTS